MSAPTASPEWLASYGRFRMLHDRVCTLLATAPTLLKCAVDDHMNDLRKLDHLLSKDDLSPGDIQWNFDKMAEQRDALVKLALAQKRELATLAEERAELMKALGLKLHNGQLLDRSNRVMNIHTFIAHRPEAAVAA